MCALKKLLQHARDLWHFCENHVTIKVPQMDTYLYNYNTDDAYNATYDTDEH